MWCAVHCGEGRTINWSAGPGGPDGGRTGMGGRAGAGPGGWGRACSYIKTCVGIGKNAVSELNTEEKIPVLPDFSREVPDISLVFPDFY